MASSTTEWRSPLSILMGARRNDDIDLELREDYFRPRCESPLPESASVAAVAEAAAGTDIQTEPSPASHSQPPHTSFGLTSYIPFRYFGFKSSATQPSYQSKPLHPPRGAFPPPISESSTDLPHEGMISSENNEAEFLAESEQNDPRQFIAYNPNYIHPSSSTTAGGDNVDHCNNNIMTSNNFISWTDQKAIIQTTFNFTNSIIGTSIIGLGGAFAASGGGISIVILIGFAILTKSSVDLVIDMCSCPKVIALSSARNQRGHDVETDSQVLNDQSEDDSDEKTMDSRNVTSEKNGIDDHSENPDNNLVMETVDPSPLMATEEMRFTNDEVRNSFQTPTKALSEVVQQHLLTENVTPRRLSSHLHLDSNNSFKAATTTVECNDSFPQPCRYEDVGYAAFGTFGRLAVLASQFIYAFGCLVAYVVVVRDNFGVALRGIIGGPSSSSSNNDERGWLYDDNYLAFWISAIIMLPLSYTRTMKSVSIVSFASIMSILLLLVSVAYLFFTCTNAAGREKSVYDNWIHVGTLSGVVRSLGCFVLTFVGHHTLNPAYESLPLPMRNPKIWRRISTNSMIFALEASLGIGAFVYLTFGSQVPSDVLSGYPAEVTVAHIARLLLCLTMVLTFPLPFLACREIFILFCVVAHNFYHVHELNRYHVRCSIFKRTSAIASSMWSYVTCTGNNTRRILRMHRDLNDTVNRQSWIYDLGMDDEINDAVNENGRELITEPLLLEEEKQDTYHFPSIGGQRGKEIDPSPLSSRSGDPTSSESTISFANVPHPSWILSNEDGKQLTVLWHAVTTFTLWFVATIIAINVSSLSDVFQAFTGTMIAFVLPALLAFKLKGFSLLSLGIFGIGGAVGMLGAIRTS